MINYFILDLAINPESQAFKKMIEIVQQHNGWFSRVRIIRIISSTLWIYKLKVKLKERYSICLNISKSANKLSSNVFVYLRIFISQRNLHFAQN